MITDIDLRDIASQYHIPLNDVFMKDSPPSKIKSGGYIINLDDESNGRGGTHWVGMWIPKQINKPIIYFDSFGFIIPQSLINWIKLRGGCYKHNNIICNDKQIQNVNTGGCGIYSLYFIQVMSSCNKSLNVTKMLNEFNKLWSDDTRCNLDRLKKLVPYYKESD
jgi:hypothetical protein